MAGVARITLVGNLGRDPETRYTPNGRMNVRFTMAVSRRFTDQGGQQQPCGARRPQDVRVAAPKHLLRSLLCGYEDGPLPLVTVVKPVGQGPRQDPAPVRTSCLAAGAGGKVGVVV